jgi:hypothetical protein
MWWCKKKQEENIQKFRLLPVFQKFLISFLTFRRKNTVLCSVMVKNIYTRLCREIITILFNVMIIYIALIQKG